MPRPCNHGERRKEGSSSGGELVYVQPIGILGNRATCIWFSGPRIGLHPQSVQDFIFLPRHSISWKMLSFVVVFIVHMPPDVSLFAGYAQGSGIVLLRPCMGGAVDPSFSPNAPDIANGKPDIYGQLSADYAQQSAPHMKTSGKVMATLSSKAFFNENLSPPTKMKSCIGISITTCLF